MQIRRNDHWCAFLVLWLVELPRDGMLVRVDCQHGKADHQLARGRVSPTIPQASDCEGLSRGQTYTPTNGLAKFVAGFVEVIHENQSVLTLTPCSAVAGLLCGGLTSGVVGVTTDLVVFGP